LLLIPIADGEVCFHRFHWGAAGSAAKDDEVRCGLIVGWGERVIDFMVMGGTRRVEGLSVGVAAAEFRVLVGSEQEEIDVGSVVSERVIAGARYE